MLRQPRRRVGQMKDPGVTYTQLVAYDGSPLIKREVDCAQWRRDPASFAGQEAALLDEVAAAMKPVRRGKQRDANAPT